MACRNVFAQGYWRTKFGCQWTSILRPDMNVFSKLNLVVNGRLDYGSLETSILNQIWLLMDVQIMACQDTFDQCHL